MQNLSLIENGNREKCEKMWQYFIESCPDAKGSSFNHQSWKGGYFDHVTDVIEYSIILYESLSKIQILPFKLSDAILVLFLHDIEKPIKYSKVLNSPISQMTNDQIRNILIDKYEIKLDDIHLNALKYIHGEGDDYSSSKRVMNSLAAFCHCCDIISSRIFFN